MLSVFCYDDRGDCRVIVRPGFRTPKSRRIDMEPSTSREWSPENCANLASQLYTTRMSEPKDHDVFYAYPAGVNHVTMRYTLCE
jgi:hypothetical protein